MNLRQNINESIESFMKNEFENEPIYCMWCLERKDTKTLLDVKHINNNRFTGKCPVCNFEVIGQFIDDYIERCKIPKVEMT